MSHSIKQITSLTNPIVKAARKLTMKKYRMAEKLFLCEGVKLIWDAVKEGHHPQAIFFTKEVESQPRAQEFLQQLKSSPSQLYEVTHEIMEKIAARDNPQQMVAIFPQFDEDLHAGDFVQKGVWVVLEQIRDPGNLGTILRTLAAIGGAGVILVDECCDPFSIEAMRASMGALFFNRIIKTTSDEILSYDTRPMMVGTHLATDKDYRGVDYPENLWIVMGNEQKGLSDTMAKACDHLVKIPMTNRVDSLNLSVATSLMLYAAATPGEKG